MKAVGQACMPVVAQRTIYGFIGVTLCVDVAMYLSPAALVAVHIAVCLCRCTLTAGSEALTLCQADMRAH